MKILSDLESGKITKETAYYSIKILTDRGSVKDSGDFRDTHNYESQDEYFGRK
jgi:hypothetical protein